MNRTHFGNRGVDASRHSGHAATAIAVAIRIAAAVSNESPATLSPSLDPNPNAGARKRSAVAASATRSGPLCERRQRKIEAAIAAATPSVSQIRPGHPVSHD
jgi:hypothetical protein